MEWINFRHLYSFWMVNRNDGFRKASEVMNVSQSTVSEQVALLEDYLGEYLYERSTRSLKLTETGQRLFTYADEIFQKSREINRIIRDGEGGSDPVRFKVGIVGGVSRNLLYNKFQTFLERYEGVFFEVLNGSFNEHLERCQRFELDFVITTEKPPAKDSAEFVTKVIESSRLILAGKKKFINRALRGSVVRQKIPAYCYANGDGDLVENLEKRFPNTFQFHLETDDISLLRFFAASNEGVAIVPEIGVHEDLSSGNIESVPLRFLEEVKFYAVYSKRAIHRSDIESIIGTA